MISDISQASQDYLKAIYKLTAQEDRVTTSRIAEYLNIKPASVTNMIQKMAKAAPPLVDYQKHQGVTLTETGELAALEMVRHHRLLEMFLHEVLGFTWDEVHEEAERLEHCISEKMEQRIAEYLNHPRHDPHGSPIPNRQLEILPAEGVPLSSLRAGATAVIRRVADEEQLLRYLNQLGIHLHAYITVNAYVSFDQTMQLQIEGQPEPITVGARISDQIFVETIET